MASSPYASSLGRLKAHTGEFLAREAYATLTNAKDVAEIVKLLENTPYGPAIGRAAATHRGAELLEVAINSTFVQRNRQALDSTPFAGRELVELYLRRWDIQNIGLILSAKVFNRPIRETEAYFVSSRDVLAGLFAGSMTLDDFRILLGQPTLEAIAQNLTAYGYGGILLPLMEGYERSHDIFPLLQALDRDYYARVLDSARFYQGDEWNVRQFLSSEIDVRNVLLLLKGRDSSVAPDEVARRLLEGGSVGRTELAEMVSAGSVTELVGELSGRFPALPEGNTTYQAGHSLTGYEVALQRDRAVRELSRMRAYPLSISIIFSYLMLADLERTDLRRIIYGRVYDLPTAAIVDSLVVPRL
jgi:V/A-type H+-transporting ATPase subunit C